MAFLIAILIAVAQVVAVAGAILLTLSAMTRTRRAALLWLLAMITRRRLPLGLELEALGDGMLRRDRVQMNAVVDQIRNGASLGEALSANRGLVSDDMLLLARIGERADCLGEAFGQEADRLARAREQMVTSTTSPAMALLSIVLVPLILPLIVSGLMIFIIPKFEKIFDDFGTEVPWVTQKLIESSDLLAQYWYIALASLMALGSTGGVILVLAKIYAWHVRVPRSLTPGGRSRLASLALRALALPVGAGKPVSEALTPLANAVDASDRVKFGRIKSRFDAGGNLWLLLSQERLISVREGQLLDAAEKSGNLAWALHLLADRIDNRRWRWFAVAIEVVQPLVVLALGALVAFVCFGIFMPLVKLINDLS